MSHPWLAHNEIGAQPNAHPAPRMHNNSLQQARPLVTSPACASAAPNASTAGAGCYAA